MTEADCKDLQKTIDLLFSVKRSDLSLLCIINRTRKKGEKVPKQLCLNDEALDIAETILDFRYWEDANAL